MNEPDEPVAEQEEAAAPSDGDDPGEPGLPPFSLLKGVKTLFGQPIPDKF
jgi:hypothetical protein